MNLRASNVRNWTLAVMFVASAATANAQYDPPAGFYDSATGTGSTLRSQLATIMTSGHIQRSYGDFRYASGIFDRDPNNASRILLAYNRASVSSSWDSGATWNREHVWPQSLQPGSASNSSKGNLGDHHALRPCNPSINNSRGNKPFGLYGTIGSYGSQGSYYFPGDVDKGDIARCLFYSATRYQSTLTLVNGAPSGNQMGDLAALLRYHHTDPPDEFERRRNHVIYSSALNPSYYTNNRNAYIDRPELAWSALGPGNNDSTLYFGGSEPADGSSSDTIDLGVVIVGAPAPATQVVTLNKAGDDPTYFMVTPSGGATSSIEGRYNAFDIGTQSRALTIGLDGPIAAAGLLSGQVVVDNLDVSSGGTGQGANDGDDVITVDLLALDHAEASFDEIADVDELTIDFGTVTAGTGSRTAQFMIANLETTPGFTADLDIDAINASGDSGMFVTNLATASELPATWTGTYTVEFDTAAAPGAYVATYVIDVSDEDLPGAQTGVSLELTVVAEVDAVTRIYPFDDNGDGLVELSDWWIFESCLSAGGTAALNAPCDNQDYDITGISDGTIDLADFAAFQAAFNN